MSKKESYFRRIRRILLQRNIVSQPWIARDCGTRGMQEMSEWYFHTTSEPIRRVMSREQSLDKWTMTWKSTLINKMRDSAGSSAAHPQEACLVIFVKPPRNSPNCQLNFSGPATFGYVSFFRWLSHSIVAWLQAPDIFVLLLVSDWFLVRFPRKLPREFLRNAFRCVSPCFDGLSVNVV